MLNANILKPLLIARSIVYFMESIPVMLINRWLSPKDSDPPTRAQSLSAWKHLVYVLDQEAQHLQNGIYPFSALEIDHPLVHARSFFEILKDGLSVAWRMRQNQTKEFTREAQDLKEGLPEYFTRNFHFQTDGYLSEASARRYDHQVEILFTGAAGAMRRQILPILKNAANPQGHWLEVACGAGSATRAVLETFPKTKVTALDISAPYLKVAQEKLKKYPRVDFTQSNAAQLDFKDETFDVVYSVYLLHELPRKEREKVLHEAYRVLKPGGLLLIADSLQINDEPELNWALERFPKIYHEPFYKDYLNDNLEALLSKVSNQTAQSQHGFFTKMAWLKKPQSVG